jgi:hypothetical protein
MEYDEEQVDFNTSTLLFSVSWLSVRRENEPSKYAVGGLNEMRAAFERFYVMTKQDVQDDFNGAWSRLVQKIPESSLPEHPCLQGAPNVRSFTKHRKINPGLTKRLEDSASEDFTGAGENKLEYTATGRNDYITMLNGSINATTSTCRSWVQKFVKQDEMVLAFRDGGCKNISKRVQEWRLISGFFYNLHEWATNTTGKALKSEWDAYNTEHVQVPSQNEKDQGYHDYFTKALLMEVLIQLGIPEESDPINALEVEWLKVAGEDLMPPMAPGWLNETECADLEGASSSVR